MCYFCERILKESSIDWIDENLISYDEKSNEFNIQTASADPYDSGLLQNVKFCPYCGEKLKTSVLYLKGEKENA